jgi:hypothetical protein
MPHKTSLLFLRKSKFAPQNTQHQSVGVNILAKLQILIKNVILPYQAFVIIVEAGILPVRFGDHPPAGSRRSWLIHCSLTVMAVPGSDGGSIPAIRATTGGATDGPNRPDHGVRIRRFISAPTGAGRNLSR